MKIGQIKKVTFTTFRVTGSESGGVYEFEQDVTRNCRVVLSKFGGLKWQIVKKKNQHLWDWALGTDQEVLDNLELNEVMHG
tara:strand:+ start:156 stop:398 length:243 start_codon:yes stop_codon:yes gene_type:complete